MGQRALSHDSPVRARGAPTATIATEACRASPPLRKHRAGSKQFNKSIFLLSPSSRSASPMCVRSGWVGNRHSCRGTVAGACLQHRNRHVRAAGAIRRILAAIELAKGLVAVTPQGMEKNALRTIWRAQPQIWEEDIENQLGEGALGSLEGGILRVARSACYRIRSAFRSPRAIDAWRTAGASIS